jgi:amino-acid N-acetyltransferase
MTIHPHPAIAVPCHYRAGCADDAAAIDRLIAAHATEGHLLPRQLDELRLRAPNFVVAEVDGEIRACAELVPLSKRTAEVRSLVVAPELRRHGVATRLVAELRDRALAQGVASIVALVHDPRFFIRHGFSIVPHEWLPEKIARDCHQCPLFRRCGQYAMLLSLHTRRREVEPPRQPTAAAVA